jgi:hypothetical protein
VALRIVPCLCATLCVLISTSTAMGQERRSPNTVTVRALGGFLGLVEGFCEDPGGSFDWPSEEAPSADENKRAAETLKTCLSSSPDARSIGGVLGASRLLGRRQPRAGDWLVVTGNNLPVDANVPFLQPFGQLDPTLVALANDDVLRIIRASGSAVGVDRWVRGNLSVPYLASNLAIRQTRKRLNRTESRNFKLHVPEDQSVSWLGPVVLHSDTGVPPAVLEEFSDCSTIQPPGSGTPVTVQLKKGSDGDVTIGIPDGLRPGRCYVLTLTNGHGRDQLWFWTDAALTPRPVASPVLDGFPVVAKTIAGSPMIGVNLVGPDLKSLLPAEAWKWSAPGTDYELLVVDPVKALRQIVRRGTVDGQVPALVLAVSTADETALQFLDKIPEIRFVVLPPESDLLGRAANEQSADAAAGRRRYSGDLAFSSRVDTGYPQATRVVLRPEWFGETLLEVEATLDAGGSSGPVRIHAQEPTVTVVPGAELSWTLNGGQVHYAATLDQERMLFAASRQYEDCPATSAPSDRCRDFVSLWASEGATAALAARAIRRSANADVGFVSGSMLDEDFRLWVQRKIESQTNDASWISKYILERIYYESPRIVRAFVPGSSLNATLEQIVKADDTGCLVGLGGPCEGPDKEHRERLTINGRRVDARLFYSIAMPDSLAERLDLVHDDPLHAVDLVDAASAYIESGAWYEPAGESAEGLEARVQRKAVGRYRGYMAFPTLSAGLSKVKPSSAQIPSGQIEFAGTKASKAVRLAVDGELALFDGAHYAIRLPMRLDYVKKRQEDSTSYDKDSFSIGGQFDRKFDVALLGDLRIFAGAFVDGRLHDQHTTLKASTKTATEPLTITETVNFTTDLITEPSHYRHLAVGTEVLGLHKGGGPTWSFEIVRLGGRLTKGHETRAPYGATIDGEPQTIDDFLEKGPATLVGQFFAAHRDTFSPATSFELLTRAQSLTRGQFDAEFSLKVKAWKREFGGSYAGQFRFYAYDQGDNPSGFLLHRSQKDELKLTLPLWRRLVLVPSATYQRATLMRHGQNLFSNWIFDVTMSLPFVARWGEGWLFR